MNDLSETDGWGDDLPRWYSALTLFWLITFLKEIKKLKKNKHKEELALRLPLLMRILNLYVSAMRSYQQRDNSAAETFALDGIQDCLQMIEEQVARLAYLYPKCAVSVKGMINDHKEKVYRASPLLRATPRLLRCTDEEIRKVVESTVDNASAIRDLCKSMT